MFHGLLDSLFERPFMGGRGVVYRSEVVAQSKSYMKHVVGGVEPEQVKVDARRGFRKVKLDVVILALSKYSEMSGDVVPESYLRV